MATTLICVVLKSDVIHWLNVGDSRFYVLRKKHLRVGLSPSGIWRVRGLIFRISGRCAKNRARMP